MPGSLAPKSALLGYLTLYHRKTYHSETTQPQIGGGGSPNAESANAPESATVPTRSAPSLSCQIFLVQTLKRSLIPETDTHNLILLVPYPKPLSKQKISPKRNLSRKQPIFLVLYWYCLDEPDHFLKISFLKTINLSHLSSHIWLCF